jgi:hypothetical protein
VVTVQPSVAVQRQRDVAEPAAARKAAGPAVQSRREPAPVEQQDRLAAVLSERAELRQQRRRERIARLPPQVDDLHGRHRRAEPRA